MSGNNLVDITTVSQWNQIKREVTGLIIVDFHAEWCGPCKQIAPVYTSLAKSHQHVTFLRVDVDGQGTRAIAQKYQISAMPTFLAIRSGNVVDTLKGADPRGLTALLLRNDVILPPDVPNAALPFKEKGNVLYKEEKWLEAVKAYTDGLSKAPGNVLLLTNRSAANLKAGSISGAIEDARLAVDSNKGWPKAWIRLAEALEADTDQTSETTTSYENALKLMPEGKQKQDIRDRLDKLSSRKQ